MVIHGTIHWVGAGGDNILKKYWILKVSCQKKNLLESWGEKISFEALIKKNLLKKI